MEIHRQGEGSGEDKEQKRSEGEQREGEGGVKTEDEKMEKKRKDVGVIASFVCTSNRLGKRIVLSNNIIVEYY